MFDKIEEILSQAKTKSDFATILLCGSVGYLLDAQLNILGLIEPAVVGPLFATSGLGLKKAIEASFNSSFERKKAISKAIKVIAQLKKNDLIDISIKVEKNLELFKNKLLEESHFLEFLNQVIKDHLEIE